MRLRFELLANKVASFQAEPDDTHYPTEKLVKDALDALTAGLTTSSKAKIDPNKDVEVLDARYSPVTGTTYANIGDRMEEGETRLATIEGEIREGVSLTETDIGIVSPIQCTRKCAYGGLTAEPGCWSCIDWRLI